uniref:protein Wiz-like n=1 Tax=Monopterus albus TaxID=43700 RepID=UPI0009B47447|nr:protein Wiz-like [Monopterus albus]
MEPTPGTSYGPPPFNSAQPFLSCTLQSSCSPNVSGGLTSARCSWGHAGDEGSEQSEGTQPGADPGGSTQRRFRSSAFPSSLSWDSDSEKETLDEEELQHFSNPHGLAAHSPGSPSTGLRLEGGDHQEPENLPHPQRKTDLCTAVEGQANDNESTKTEQPNPSQLAGSKVWNVSEGAEPFVSNIKPKEGCQMEEEEEEAGNSEGEKRPEAKETKEPERDVYTFPGDSDPESPPPAPWAHCTFIQRCKKKRVLLRPFSGLGTMKRTLPEADKWARASPQKTKTPETTRLTQGGGVYDFEEAGDGEAAVEEPKLRDRGGKREESGVESAKEIFTCVECSIYFKKQVHLQEHMAEHCHSGSGGGRRSGKAGRFQCIECGWSLPNRLALADHHRRHQESRLKILAEIEKLNENGKPREIQKLDRKAMKHLRPDPAVRQHASLVLIPGKVSDSEIVTSPAVSPAPVSSPEAAVDDSETAPPDSVRSPTPTQAGSACRRRRFVCNKCNFSTRTSQALANHSKTHNRKKPTLQANSSPPVSPSCLLTPPSLACAQCAFLTSSQTVLREHQKLVHPGLGGAQDEETELHSGSNVGAQKSKPLLDSDQLSGSGSVPSAALGDSPQRVMAFEESTTAEGAAARPAGRVLPGSGEEEQDGDESTEPDSEAGSPGAVQPHTRARASTDDCPALQSATLSPPHVRSLKDGDEQEVENKGKVFFLRKSAQVTATPAGTDSDDDDDDNSDEEQVRRFLSEGILGEDENDEDVEALKSVERKCPYCPDRFHNGIGLANHVRGHLNRVGVSYNVRHFISPEEVNAIEKKFSYQKKKKKVLEVVAIMYSSGFQSGGGDTHKGHRVSLKVHEMIHKVRKV